MPLEQCIKIAEQTGVSLDWLILGKGDPYQDEPSPGEIGVALVPLYDVVASAGSGNFFDSENVRQYVPLDKQWMAREGLYSKDLSCLPIRGDSMTPGLIDGDIVLLNRARLNGDGVFVLRLGEALRIKRLQWLADGSLRISSDNPLYHAEHVRPDELGDDFAIIGACHTRIGRVA